ADSLNGPLRKAAVQAATNEIEDLKEEKAKALALIGLVKYLPEAQRQRTLLRATNLLLGQETATYVAAKLTYYLPSDLIRASMPYFSKNLRKHLRERLAEGMGKSPPSHPSDEHAASWEEHQTPFLSMMEGETVTRDTPLKTHTLLEQIRAVKR